MPSKRQRDQRPPPPTRPRRQITGIGPEELAQRKTHATAVRWHASSEACTVPAARVLLLFGRLLPRPRPAPRRPRLGGLGLGGLGLEQGGGLLGGALRGFRRLELARARSRRPACRPWRGTRPRRASGRPARVISTVTSGWRWTLILCAPRRLDRLVELDLAALDLDARRGGAVGDVARGHRTVELQRPRTPGG